MYRGGRCMFMLLSNRAELCGHQPSGNASLPDCAFFYRFAMGLRRAAAQTCLRDFIPQTPFFASRGYKLFGLSLAA